jgi:hypothetical protein
MIRYTGGCLCGAVRYSIDAEPLPGRQLLCHCVDCQKHTGTAFVSGMAFPSDAVAITGTMTTFTMPGGQSGEANASAILHAVWFADRDREGWDRAETAHGGNVGRQIAVQTCDQSLL